MIYCLIRNINLTVFKSKVGGRKMEWQEYRFRTWKDLTLKFQYHHFLTNFDQIPN